MLKYIATYLLGAFTFWPPVGFLVYYGFKKFNPPPPPPPSIKNRKPFLPPACLISDQEADKDSEVLFKGTIRLAPVPALDPQADIDNSQSRESKSATSALRKIIKGDFFKDKDKQDKDKEKQDKDSTNNNAKFKDYKQHKISYYPEYFVVLRGGQLQFYNNENELDKQPSMIIVVPEHLVTIWPQKLKEYELFYRRYPICLIHRTDLESLASLDCDDDSNLSNHNHSSDPPANAFYLYCDNTSFKEDLYFALIKESRINLLKNPPITGHRDANLVAVPLTAKRDEMHELQSNIWHNDLLKDTQWINGLLGRMFLGVKDSEHVYSYLHERFTSKLRTISSTSNLVGDIEVKDICTGTSAPLVTAVNLREFSADGRLVVAADLTYSGGFRVHLATTVRLAAVTAITSVEIPLELVASLKEVRGTVLFVIKPPPSDRLWYTFESMPEVDLQIEPAVYDTQISLSVVTKFIRSRILESFKESMVFPFMDDVAFYDTVDKFYRGGIWTAPKIGQNESLLGDPFNGDEILVNEHTSFSTNTPGKSSTRGKSTKRKPTVYESPLLQESGDSNDANFDVNETNRNPESNQKSNSDSVSSSSQSKSKTASVSVGGGKHSASHSSDSGSTNLLSIPGRKRNGIEFPPVSNTYSSPIQGLVPVAASPTMYSEGSPTKSAMASAMSTGLNSSQDSTISRSRSATNDTTASNISVKTNGTTHSGLEFNPTITLAQPSTGMSNLSASGEVSIDSSLCNRRFSELSDNRSSSSRKSSTSRPPHLPPRNRKFISLANVPPETVYKEQ